MGVGVGGNPPKNPKRKDRRNKVTAQWNMMSFMEAKRKKKNQEEIEGGGGWGWGMQ